MTAAPGPIFLSVVVPVYNEEKRVEECLRRLAAFLSLKKEASEILICSDGSTDRTDAITGRFIDEHSRPTLLVRLLTSPTNSGKGAVVRHGVFEARGEVILMTDVDLSAPPKESDKLLRALEEGYDAAIGSRGVRSKGADVQQSPLRWLSGRIFNAFVRLLVVNDFQDTQCGFKCFKREAARTLFKEQAVKGFAFDVEILARAKKAGLRVKEVPVMWRESRTSKVHLFRDSFFMLKDLFLIRGKV